MTAAGGHRRWLIVSYFSRIDGMACAQHIDDRIPSLQARGVEPLMLTGICGQRWPGMTHVTAPSVAPSGVRFELRHLRKKGRIGSVWAGLLSLLVLPFYLLEKLLMDLDSQWSWFPLAITRGVRLCRQYKPEVIYSTGGPPSAHLAAAIIARRCQVPWYAEFQDPLVHEDWLRSRRAYRAYAWLERLVCARADGVVFLTDGARKNADARTALGRRGHVVYPGADPGAMPAVDHVRRAHCHFAHFGSLGGSRNLCAFLEGLRLALQEHPELSSVLRLDLYGSCDAVSRRLIQAFGHPDMFQDFGRVLRRDSLVAMKQCDVLLLIQNTELFSTETIPSKTYEYLHAGRPVLALVHHNPELAQMLLEQGHRVVAADDPVEIRAAILECHQAWAAQGMNRPPSASPYTVDAAVDRLMHLSSQSAGPCTSQTPWGAATPSGGKPPMDHSHALHFNGA